MKHVIEVFDKRTEELLQSVEVPSDRREDLAKLMNWLQPEDEFDGYDLSPEQIDALEQWTGKALNDENHIVQLVCIE
jgi:hypothetical protein